MDLGAKRALGDLIGGLAFYRVWGMMSLREVRRRYRRTLFGPFWVTITLLIFSSVLGIIWSSLWKQDISAFLPYLLSGLIPWTFISMICSESCAAFLSAETLVRNRAIPYSFFIFGVISRNFIVMAHNLLAVIIIYLFFLKSISLVNFVQLLLGFLILMATSWWIGMMLAMASARYRDVQQGVSSFLQIVMFITPIFWPKEMIGADRMILVDINPLMYFIEIIRLPLLGESVPGMHYLVTALITILGTIFALLIMSRKLKDIIHWL